MMMQEQPAFITIPIEEYKLIISEVQALKARIDALEAHQLDDTARLARDIALDRQRLARLEKVEPQPLQRDRGEILRALIVANGGKMLAKDARQKMHLSRSRFSELLATMGEYIDTKPYYLNKSAKVLILK